MKSLIRSLVVLVTVAVVALSLTACGNKGADVDKSLQSAVSAKFQEKTVDGERHLVGHGVAMTLPADWVSYEPERVGDDGTTHEYAMGLPADTKPLPSGVQYSMGMPDKGVGFKNLPENAKKFAATSAGYRFIDDGDVSVDGAKDAKFLRFEHDLEIATGVVRVEQVSLFLEIDDTTSSTIRFIAPAGEWDAVMKPTYDSVVVAPTGDDA